MDSSAESLQRQEVRRAYQERRKNFEKKSEQLARRALWFSTARLVVFIAMALSFLGGFWGLRMSSPPLVLCGALGFVAFVVLVLLHDKVLKAQDRMNTLVKINEDSLERMDRIWANLPVPPVDSKKAAEPVARDLDLFPHDHNDASVYRLLGTVHTPQGTETLAEWLLDPADPKEIPLRQEAVRELAPKIDFRQELELLGRLLGEKPPDPEKFLSWAESEPWLHKKIWLLWLSRILGATAVSLAVLNIIGIVSAIWLGLSLGFNLLFAFILSKKILSTYDRISGREQACRHYAQIFRLLDSSRFQSEKLKDLEKILHSADKSVSDHMKWLDTLGGLADARFTPLFHLPLVALTLWDFHVLYAFEKWQLNAGEKVRTWFSTLGEYESLSALATLSYDHPEWAFPTVIKEEKSIIKAEKIGHPLLPVDSCVRNDVELGPEGSYLLVTGSNMSGKSTLLRSIGTNAVLAQIGAPVCAEKFSMPPVVLGTSFRVHDSIEAGVSFFMAELRRLKQIVDLARDHQDSDDKKLLFLLDEILQGTNVYERQVAVRRVILFLIKYGAIGAISTHDLTLADADGLAEASVACHFAESYEQSAEGPSMHFDYLLRDGIASTRNALKLLEIVGLSEERLSSF